MILNPWLFNRYYVTFGSLSLLNIIALCIIVFSWLGWSVLLSYMNSNRF